MRRRTRPFNVTPKVENKKLLEIALRSVPLRGGAGLARGALKMVGLFNDYNRDTEGGPIGATRGSWQQKTAGAGR
jgi:hypothetical protein